MQRGNRLPVRAVGVVFALAAALAACGGESSPSDRWRGTMTTLPNGAVVVSNPDRGMWSAAEAWALTEDLRIGRAEGEGPDVFWGIAGFGVAPNGDVFVIDRSQEIRRFQSTGELVRAFGRQGEGPGEFIDAFGMAFDPDGNAWIADGGSKRYSVFSAAGTLQRTLPMIVLTFATPWEGVFDREGRLYEGSISVAPDWSHVAFTSVRLDRAGRIDTVRDLGDTVALIKGFPLPDMVGRQVFSFDAGGTVWRGRTDRYRIIHQRLDTGDTLRIVERPLAPVPITDAEKDSLARQYKLVGIQASDVPDARPLFQRIYGGPDGTLFVQLVTSPSATESVFDVFDQEGRFLGQLLTPTRLVDAMGEPPPRVHGDGIYGIVKDSLGVPSLVRYRITKPGGGTP
ncbi:MAG: hypothetical protein Q8N53_21925 [Longimicrobiales bacterium]|nr:hypothetical protein [Longimicrobiales bacterium]